MGAAPADGQLGRAQAGALFADAGQRIAGTVLSGRTLDSYTLTGGALDRADVYVESFPTGAGKFQISTGEGGRQPRWRRDGKELFYLSTDGKLMSVEVKTEPRFAAGAPKPLFDVRQFPSNATAGGPFRYDVAPDGKRFLIDSLATATEDSDSAPITVVLNWPAALKK